MTSSKPIHKDQCQICYFQKKVLPGIYEKSRGQKSTKKRQNVLEVLQYSIHNNLHNKFQSKSDINSDITMSEYNTIFLSFQVYIFIMLNEGLPSQW